MRDYVFSYDPSAPHDWEQIRDRLRSENGIFNVSQHPEEARIVLTAHPEHWEPESLADLVPMELEYLGEVDEDCVQRPSRTLAIKRSEIPVWTLRDPERVPGIEEKLETVQGVSSARVNFADRVVKVEYDPERCSREELEDQLVGEGVRPGTIHKALALVLITVLAGVAVATVWFIMF